VSSDPVLIAHAVKHSSKHNKPVWDRQGVPARARRGPDRDPGCRPAWRPDHPAWARRGRWRAPCEGGGAHRPI